MAKVTKISNGGPKARTRKVRALTGFTRIAWAVQAKGPNGYAVRIYKESYPIQTPQGDAIISDTLAMIQMGIGLAGLPIVPEQSPLDIKPVDPNEYRRPVRIEVSVEQPGSRAEGTHTADTAGTADDDEPEPFAEVTIRFFKSDEQPERLKIDSFPGMNLPPTPAR